MSLKNFHIVFVCVSVLVSVFLGVWAIVQGQGYLWLGVVSILFAGAMVAYGIVFWRKMKDEAFLDKAHFSIVLSSLIAAAGLFGVCSDAQACSVCFGAKDSYLTQGLNMGIITLLVIILSVLAIFGKFFLNFCRRAKAMSGSGQGVV